MWEYLFRAMGVSVTLSAKRRRCPASSRHCLESIHQSDVRTFLPVVQPARPPHPQFPTLLSPLFYVIEQQYWNVRVSAKACSHARTQRSIYRCSATRPNISQNLEPQNLSINAAYKVRNSWLVDCKAHFLMFGRVDTQPSPKTTGRRFRGSRCHRLWDSCQYFLLLLDSDCASKNIYHVLISESTQEM